jgi:uncharacterized protein YdeI (YjbR/CyaY-like superfamily)
MMEIGKTLYVKDREQWREWLANNFTKEKEIWLIFPAKKSDKPRIEYNEAVEEALAFGWIDSTVKRYDEQASAQRFSPRQPHSEYSQANKERLKCLLKANKVHPSMQKSVEATLKKDFQFPPDIIQAIKASPRA